MISIEESIHLYTHTDENHAQGHSLCASEKGAQQDDHVNASPITLGPSTHKHVAFNLGQNETFEFHSQMPPEFIARKRPELSRWSSSENVVHAQQGLRKPGRRLSFTFRDTAL